MGIQLLQLDTLFKELPGTLAGALCPSGPELLDGVLTVSPQVEDYGRVLSKVKAVYSVRGHVEHTVSPLVNDLPDSP